MVFLFCFIELTYFFPMWLFTIMLFVPVRKRANSRSQLFYKRDALKNLAIFTGKHPCWSFFLINFIKKVFQHRCLPVNIVECLSTIFFIEQVLCIILFPDYMWRYNSLEVFGYEIDIFHISCAIALLSFIIVVLQSDFVYILFLYQNF